MDKTKAPNLQQADPFTKKQKTVMKNILIACIIIAAGSIVPAHGAPKTVASETRTFQTVRTAEFLYDCVETLPATPERIIFGLMHEDENLEESCASQKKHSFIRSSNSPAFVKTLNLVNNALAKILQNRTAQSEALTTIVLETTDEAFVVRFSFRRDSKASTRNNVRIAAQITTYGLTKELPPHFLNFLKALVLENTVMQNHAIKIIPAVAIALLAGIKLNRVIRRHIRRSAASMRTRQPERAPAPAITENRRAPTAPQPQPQPQHAPAPATTQNRRAHAEGALPQPQETPPGGWRTDWNSLYDAIFNYTNKMETSYTHNPTYWFFGLNRFGLLCQPFGGIDALARMLSDPPVTENENLWKLFRNPNNGIIARFSKDTEAYTGNRSFPNFFRTRDLLVDALLRRSAWPYPLAERIPWTYLGHETENYQHANYYH